MTKSIPVEERKEDDTCADIRRKREFKNGTVVIEYTDGRREQTTKEGVRLVAYPDGRQVQTDPSTSTVIELLPDGTKIQRSSRDNAVIKLLPDGTRMETKPDGTLLEVSPDGIVTETRSNGVVIKLFPDGRKEQHNPGADRVIRMPSGKQELSKEEVDPSELRVLQTLRVLSDGSHIQINQEGEWRLILKDSTGGETIQKGDILNAENQVVGSKYLWANHERRVLIEGNKQTNVDLVSKNSSVGEVDIELLQKLKTRCANAERACEMVPHQVQVQLTQTEMALVAATKDFDLQLGTIKARTEQLRKQNEVLKQQLASLSAEAAKRDVPKVSTSTQWTLRDAESQFFKRQFTQDLRDSAEELYADPKMARALVAELKARIMVLEDEKQEVEDRLIDLRFSLQSESLRKKQNLLLRLIPLLHFSKNKKTSEAALTRKESLLAAMANIKQRQEKVSDELSMKRRESVRLASETKELRDKLESMTKARNEAVDRCNLLQERIDAFLSGSPELCFPEDDDRASVSSICLLPSIDEEKHTQITLSPVSPMI